MLPHFRAPTHPGVILDLEFLEPEGITQIELAEDLRLPVQRINGLIKGKRGISPETALLLGRKFGVGPEFWMNLQSAYDLYLARKKLGW